MNKFKLLVELDNAAFDDDTCAPEIARILRDLAYRIEDNPKSVEWGVRDINGNTVGRALKFKKPKGEEKWG